MSGKPTPRKAERVLEILEQVTELSEIISSLTPQVQRMTRELAAKTEKRQLLQREMSTLMSEMDCDVPGNYGWDGRVSWLVYAVYQRWTEKAARTSVKGTDG